MLSTEISYLQLKNFTRFAGNLCLLTYSNGPNPDYLFPIGDYKDFSPNSIRDPLGGQEFAKLLFLTLAQRNKPVAGSAIANGKRWFYFIQVKPLCPTGGGNFRFAILVRHTSGG